MATWQAAEPGTVVGDGQGNYQIRQAGQWTPMPKGSLIADEHGAYHFDSDALKPPPAAAPAPRGATDTEAESPHPINDVINMLKAVPGGIGSMLEGIGKNATEHPILGNIPALIDTFKRVAADPSGTLTSISNAVQNATPEQVGHNVVAPLVAGGLAGEGAGLASRLGAASAAEAATPAGALGLRTAGGLPAKMAGNTAGPTLDAQNLRASTSVLGADAGVPHTSPVNASTLETAREAPGQLLDQGYNLIPPGPLSPAARQQVLAARGPATITKPTPNVANQINDIESSLLNPEGQFTGEQLRATRNSLNSDASAGTSSTDADARAVAQYKRNVVGALDQHLADSLPQGSAITPDQVLNARSTLAKNYQLQDLIGKGGDINLQALAKLHRDSPNLLTGNTRTVAQFASDHPEVTGPISDADRISPPSFMNDVAAVNPLKPIGTLGQAVFGAVGRRLLRGPSGEAIGTAMRAPVAGLGGEFDVGPPAPSAEGITATPLTQSLGDIMPSQRGAVGTPTDISGLRQLMNNKRTYGGAPAVTKPVTDKVAYDAYDAVQAGHPVNEILDQFEQQGYPRDILEHEIQVLKGLTQQPTTYSGIPLGQAFKQ